MSNSSRTSSRTTSATNTQAYKRARERAKARSAVVTLAGQDIAPLPPVRDLARRNRADNDLRFFCETYFPHLFTLSWSDDHLRVIATIERVVLYNETLAVAMPRGSGKTTLCLVAVMWAILTGRHSFIYLVASTQESALSLLANIKSHLAGNELLLADYPEAVYPIRCLEGEARRCNGQRYYGVPTRITWAVDEIVFPTLPGSRCSGSIIRVSGITGNIRGALHVRPDGNSVRPSLVVCDDPQTDQSAKSPLQTAERLSILNGAIRGLAGPGLRTAVIVPCTVIEGGDLADQLLDRNKNPHWHGERTKLIYAFPTDEKNWAEYFRLRDESLRADGDGSVATEFYRERQEIMDAGAIVAWPQRFLAGQGEISAVQHAMNLRHDNEEAFFAEYQNDPKPPASLTADVLTVQQVMAKANGRSRLEVPLACSKLTMFVDVHKKVLFYAVCGWQDDFTGFVIDYGTFPPQRERFFAAESAKQTLEAAFPGLGVESAVQAGLEQLVSSYLSREFRRGSNLMRIDRLCVDMGWEPARGVIAAVKHKAGGTAMLLYKGLGIKAGRKPMSTWTRKPGETHGHYWVIPNVSRTAEFPHVAADVNYWKSFVHERLALAAGTVGSLTIFGRERDHELFARHIAQSETWTTTEGWGRKVNEWTARPGRPDNHWLDCLTGNAVAASTTGLTLPGQATPKRQRKRYTQEDLTRKW